MKTFEIHKHTHTPQEIPLWIKVPKQTLNHELFFLWSSLFSSFRSFLIHLYILDDVEVFVTEKGFIFSKNIYCQKTKKGCSHHKYIVTV